MASPHKQCVCVCVCGEGWVPSCAIPRAGACSIFRGRERSENKSSLGAKRTRTPQHHNNENHNNRRHSHPMRPTKTHRQVKGEEGWVDDRQRPV